MDEMRKIQHSLIDEASSRSVGPKDKALLSTAAAIIEISYSFAAAAKALGDIARALEGLTASIYHTRVPNG